LPHFQNSFDFIVNEILLGYDFSMGENLWVSKWSSDQIHALLMEQFQAFWDRDTGLERSQLEELLKSVPLPHAVVISGLRRTGKSTLLAQLAHRLGRESFYYVSFEDERFLGFSATDANHLYGQLVELFGERKTFLLDEIQNVPEWERFIRRFMDQGFKFFLTGSNASLLSKDLGTRLTGRYVPIELFPFSFPEYMKFRGYPIQAPRRHTTAESARLRSHLDEYLLAGGIPESIRYPQVPLLRTLYDDVLYRDIAARHHIEDMRPLKELAYFLMSNPSCAVSFNKLKTQLGLGSVNTVKNYVAYMENGWLLFTMNEHAFSVKRQQTAPKKVYIVDPGMANAIGFRFAPNTGHLRENVVFITLRRGTRNLFYVRTPSGREVDFFLPEKNLLIQVTQNMNLQSIRERELGAMSEALSTLKAASGLILADANGEPIHERDTTIEIRSLAEWLLEN
jgi:uncharacterized protein